MSAAEDDRVDVARLSVWLQANGIDVGCPLVLTRFGGGQSNPTYRLDGPSQAYVLRRKPRGPLVGAAHAIDREFRVLSALHRLHFPVPAPVLLCMDRDIIGSAFYLMQLLSGDHHWDGALPGLTPVQRTQTYYALIDTLATLHSIDYIAAGLGDYGAPDGYVARQVSRWSARYRAAQSGELPEMERLLEWLPATIPAEKRGCLVHGDFRIDNVIFARGEPRVLGVLDWELSTLGDPLVDLAYLLMNWLPGREGGASVAGLDVASLGIPTMAELSARYCTKTGRTHSPDLKWYFSFNLFRLACILQDVGKRALNGTASNSRAGELAQRVPQLARCAWASAREAGAR